MKKIRHKMFCSGPNLTWLPVIFGGTGPDQPATESGLVSLGGPGGGTSHHRAKRRDSDPETAERASAVGGGVPGVTGGVVVAGSVGVVANEKSGSLEIIPESCPLDPNGRLSISLDDHNVSSPSSCGSHPLHSRSVVTHHADFRYYCLSLFCLLEKVFFLGCLAKTFRKLVAK